VAAGFVDILANEENGHKSNFRVCHIRES
jgi:hypothetical protein